jgi:hypothetical protein
MKKTTKLIAMLTVIALVATMAAAALADDKLYTSQVFSIPKERVEEDLSQIEMPEPQKEEEPEEPEPEEVFEDEPEEKTTEGKTQRKVLIKSSRGDTVIEGEIITLKSKLVGFDGVEVHYQWQVDRGDGEGWVDVEGATGPEHSFVARKDTILYSWRLTISTDE